MDGELHQILRMNPEFRDYVWGGQRLRPGLLTAEAWIIYENNIISSGPYKGQTLARLSESLGAGLLGERAITRTGNRFPLLIKLLDCQQWLSLQVHPDDEHARTLEGINHFGKTEAWYFLETADDSQIIAGIKPKVTGTQLSNAIGKREILDLVEYHPVKQGDSLFMAAGTIHALGPEMLVYEVQQTSDLTYRVYDWDRPQGGGRILHVEKARAVSNPLALAKVIPGISTGANSLQQLIQSPYFNLEKLNISSSSWKLVTDGLTFHALTFIEGDCKVIMDNQEVEVKKYDSVLIPAAAGEYEIVSKSVCHILKSSVN
jgi:mannose-6-phosphate isomerase